MFRFKTRSLFILTTGLAIVLTVAVSAWNEGDRHERLRKSMVERQASVKLTYYKYAPPKARDPKLIQVSKLPGVFDRIGLSKLVRRVESITLYTRSMSEAEIELLLDDVRAVHSFETFFIFEGNISNGQIVSIVSDVSVKRLAVRVDALRQSDGKWLDNTELKYISLLGDVVEKKDLTMLPPSIEGLVTQCAPASDIDASDFERFPKLESIDFQTTKVPQALRDDLRLNSRYKLHVRDDYGSNVPQWPPPQKK